VYEHIIIHSIASELHYKCANGIYLQDFTQYNKKYGWKNGDLILSKLAKELETISSGGLVFRLYGDDFILLTKEYFDVQKYSESLDNFLKDSGITLRYKYYDIEKLNIENITDLEILLSTSNQNKI